MKYEIHLSKEGRHFIIQKQSNFQINIGDSLYYDFVASGNFEPAGLGVSGKEDFKKLTSVILNFKVVRKYIHDEFISLGIE